MPRTKVMKKIFCYQEKNPFSLFFIFSKNWRKWRNFRQFVLFLGIGRQFVLFLGKEGEEKMQTCTSLKSKVFSFLSHSIKDRCQSGRMSTLGKRVYLHRYRGFESRPVRHLLLSETAECNNINFWTPRTLRKGSQIRESWKSLKRLKD